MSKGKVVLVGPSHPYRGGLASYSERLTNAFMQKGYDAEIFTFTLQYPNFLFPGKSQYSQSEAPKNIKIQRKINSVNPLNWWKVGRELKKMQPEVLVFKFWLPFMAPCFGTIARIVKKNNYTKVICIIDNIIPHEKRIGDASLTRYFVKSMDGFIGMSKSVLDDLNQFDQLKPRLFNPHPLFDNFGEKITKNEACKNIGISPDANYVLFFGFVRAYKGLDLLIEAFADNRFQNSNIRLIIAGEYYGDKEKYENLIDKYNLNEKIVQRTDFIPDEEVRNYFCAADIVAQPYKSATQSGVTQIGYHFEKAMLVTNVGGLPEIIAHKKIGYVVEPKSNEIADALISYFENQEQRVFEENIQVEKQRFSWDKMVDRVDELRDLL